MCSINILLYTRINVQRSWNRNVVTDTLTIILMQGNPFGTGIVETDRETLERKSVPRPVVIETIINPEQREEIENDC